MNITDGTKENKVVEEQTWKAKWLVLAIGALYLPNVGFAQPR